MANEFKPGDIVRHKATLKRCVVKRIDGEKVLVTTEDDDVKNYYAVELEPYIEPDMSKLSTR